MTNYECCSLDTIGNCVRKIASLGLAESHSMRAPSRDQTEEIYYNMRDDT